MIDLHTHTLFSDGELLPSELVRRAEAVLGYGLPHLAGVVTSVLQQYRPSTLQREIVP